MELTRIWATWTSALTHAALRILPVQLSDIQQQSDYGYTTLQACPQTDSIMPIQHLELYFKINDSLHSPSFQNKTYTVLGGAVQIPFVASFTLRKRIAWTSCNLFRTESYDDMLPVGQDPRWDVFQTLHDYLNVSFPSVLVRLKAFALRLFLTIIRQILSNFNHESEYLRACLPLARLRYGVKAHPTYLSSRPVSLRSTGFILSLAHLIDVVPVDSTTLAEWEYPPYSGYFDGQSNGL